MTVPLQCASQPSGGPCNDVVATYDPVPAVVLVLAIVVLITVALVVVQAARRRSRR